MNNDNNIVDNVDNVINIVDDDIEQKTFNNLCKRFKIVDIETINVKDYLPEDCQKIITSHNFQNKTALFAREWYIKDCLNSPKSLFIFEDNDIKKGVQGQAVIRMRKNTIGVPVKKLPSKKLSANYKDDEYDENCEKIFNVVIEIIRLSENYDELVFPYDGYRISIETDNGNVKLTHNAPKTQMFIDKVIDDCFGIDYVDIRKNGLQAQLSIPKELSKSKNKNK